MEWRQLGRGRQPQVCPFAPSFEDLENIAPDDVARIVEWLTEKVDALSTRLKPEPKEDEEARPQAQPGRSHGHGPLLLHRPHDEKDRPHDEAEQRLGREAVDGRRHGGACIALTVLSFM
jgi:hypothetical protein